MQVCVVGDIHLGPKCEKSQIRNAVIAGQERFFKNLAADLRGREIKTILFSGDIFTVRPFMTIGIMEYAVRLFRDILGDFDIHVICGNHDLVYDNSDELSSLVLLELLPNVHVYRKKVASVKLLGRTWYMVPWVLPGNYQATADWLDKLARKPAKTRNSTVIFGHFDITGMLMEAGQTSVNGLDPEKFYAAAPYVISGHYHCRSFNKGPSADSSILYLGSPYHLGFAHVGTDCGYYILDDDMNIEFVENTDSPRFVDVDDEHLEGLGDLSNRFVRYYARNDRNFDDARARKKVLEEANPIYIKTVFYGGEVDTIEEARRLDDEEARRVLGADTLTMAEMYMDKYPGDLPVFWSGENPKEKILDILRTYAFNR